MTNDYDPSKPTLEEYQDWYSDQFLISLDDGTAENWFNLVTAAGRLYLEESSFWKALRASWDEWNEAFVAENKGYQLLESSVQPERVNTKSFESAVNKSFRWNVLENNLWPKPPQQRPSTAPPTPPTPEYVPVDDPQLWFGPGNWLTDFPDIFRVRLVATYFDGVRYLADEVKKLAENHSSRPPEVSFKASNDGYHAAHIRVYHELQTQNFPDKDDVAVDVRLEIQIVTVIQDSISKLLHKVYRDWRVNGPPQDWEWDHESLAFSVNYLGHTLHYLEAMIVNVRNQERNNL